MLREAGLQSSPAGPAAVPAAWCQTVPSAPRCAAAVGPRGTHVGRCRRAAAESGGPQVSGHSGARSARLGRNQLGRGCSGPSPQRAALPHACRCKRLAGQVCVLARGWPDKPVCRQRSEADILQQIAELSLVR